MKRNSSGQFIGAQLNSKTDGSAVTTGTTTVSYTGDNGTYTTGSVGSGAATHKGGGYWEYAPSAGETNFAHVAFTFVNTSAVTATVQIFTSFPQSADAPTANDNAAAFLKLDWTTITGEAARSCLNAFRVLRNKWALPGGVYTVYEEDDSTVAWTGTPTTDAGGAPITGMDPT